jgi:hypothetical protein
MPLTAYSISQEKELDVEQILGALSKAAVIHEPVTLEHLPDPLRELLRTDLECPCCFVTGAEIVREARSRSSGNRIRQPCFRFAGHQPQCDFASTDAANAIPENLVDFGKANSSITRVVRELICTGIQTGAFNQKWIRNMREWFFQKKVVASFSVTLDPRYPKWVDTLWRIPSPLGHLPPGVDLTAEIAGLPGFDWSAEARRIITERHSALINAIQEHRLWMHDVADRIESLAKRYQGKTAFDPTVLENEYNQSLHLARFISHNYAPVRSVSKNTAFQPAAGVLALSALLLFVNAWNLSQATAMFVAIATAAGHADQSLGNVMGLNPFHDYEAWMKLKQLQSLGISLSEDPGVELKTIEAELRSRFRAS